MKKLGFLGGGKSPFAGVKEPQTLQLAQTSTGRNGAGRRSAMTPASTR